jgi:hypothetical protein
MTSHNQNTVYLDVTNTPLSSETTKQARILSHPRDVPYVERVLGKDQAYRDSFFGFVAMLAILMRLCRIIRCGSARDGTIRDKTTTKRLVIEQSYIMRQQMMAPGRSHLLYAGV